MYLSMPMDGLLARLQKCRADVVGPGKKKALRAGAKVVKAAMVAKAPVLKKEIATSTALPPGAVKAGIRIYMTDEDGDPAALVGPSAKVEHVTRFVEFGHRMVTGGYSKVLPGGKSRGPGKAKEKDVPPYPFLRPAYEESIGAAVEAEKISLAETIQGAVK
jgi:HK97 gp10 family phage protein